MYHYRLVLTIILWDIISVYSLLVSGIAGFDWLQVIDSIVCELIHYVVVLETMLEPRYLWAKVSALMKLIFKYKKKNPEMEL